MPAASVVDAELVRSEHDSMRGLMYRKSLGAERGMLFDLLVRDDHKFWMHNTCIPLDLLYIDEDGLLVGIVENAPTLNDESRGVGCPSRWVLEVNAGWCATPRRQGRPARRAALARTSVREGPDERARGQDVAAHRGVDGVAVQLRARAELRVQREDAKRVVVNFELRRARPAVARPLEVVEARGAARASPGPPPRGALARRR